MAEHTRGEVPAMLPEAYRETAAAIARKYLEARRTGRGMALTSEEVTFLFYATDFEARAHQWEKGIAP